METSRARAWLALELLFPLLAPSVSYPDRFVVSSRAGSEVLLPCPCPPLGPPAVPHLQWNHEDSETVLEQRGAQVWTKARFSGRVQVPESGPETGNCSLLLRDLQISDSGLYDGYLIQDSDQTRTKTQTKRGVLICTIKILVFEHTSVQYKSPGSDLVLDLHSPQAMSLVFQHSNSSEWRPLWQRGVPAASPRVLSVPSRLQLRLRSLSVSDEGVYKVLDQNGLCMSSTWVYVSPDQDPDQDREESSALKFVLGEQRLLRGSSLRSSSSCLLLVVTSALSSLL